MHAALLRRVRRGLPVAARRAFSSTGPSEAGGSILVRPIDGQDAVVELRMCAPPVNTFTRGVLEQVLAAVHKGGGATDSA